MGLARINLGFKEITMETLWKKVPHSAWILNQEAILSDLKAQGFVPTTDPPTKILVIESDHIEIEVKVVEPG